MMHIYKSIRDQDSICSVGESLYVSTPSARLSLNAAVELADCKVTIDPFPHSQRWGGSLYVSTPSARLSLNAAVELADCKVTIDPFPHSHR